MGSFYAVVGIRLSLEESFLKGRSHCDKCHHTLHFFDLIPIFSYLFLRGKCRYCHEKISVLFPLIELFSGLLFFLCFYSFGFSLDLLLGLSLVSLFLIVVTSDLTYLIIPDQVLIFFSIEIIIIQLFRIGFTQTLLHIATGVFLFLLMYIIMLFGNHVFNKESMGGADVKLMFIFGLVLDPLIGTISIFLGSFIALPVSIYLYYSTKDNVIPFGPFLLIGFLILFFSKITSLDIINLIGL